LAQSHPPDHAAQEARLLWHGVENVNGSAAEEAEVSGIDGKRRIRQFTKGAVKQLGREALEQALTMTCKL
jgi:hypothetical protein